MNWRKLGVVFSPPSDVENAVSHAQIPTPLQLNEDIVRVYYSARDEVGCSRPYFVDLDARDPLKVVQYGKQPLLDLGEPGCFDDNGIITCSVIKHPDGRLLMYYVGFELHKKVRYKLFTGLAISEDGEIFEKYSHAPILDRTHEDLCFRCGPFVHCSGGNEFVMYYVSGGNWITLNGKSMPVYVVKRVCSEDGIHWPDNGPVVLPITMEDEHGFGRPWVVPCDGGYEMYYSVRRKSVQAYRLGWAHSHDGVRWMREDERIGLAPGPGVYDSHAIMYSAVITLHGKTYCFYNGNDFGVDGFALAVKEEA